MYHMAYGFCMAGIHNGLTQKWKPFLPEHFMQMLQAVRLLQKKSALELELLHSPN